jgi:hypothetical protein
MGEAISVGELNLKKGVHIRELPEKLAQMFTSKFILDVAIQFKLGHGATE